MTKKILKLWVVPQVEVCTPEIELLKCFPFATPQGSSFVCCDLSRLYHLPMHSPSHALLVLLESS